MAKAGVEAAIWDLEAKQAEQPLWRYIGGTRADIACGVSIGLQDSTAALLDKVSDALECGCAGSDQNQTGEGCAAGRSGAWPVSGHHALSRRKRRASSLVTDSPLARLDEFGLLMIEQPLAPGDLVDHAKLQRRVRTSICLDESILSLAHAQHAHELGACRIINIKLGRVGGYSEAKNIQAFSQAHGMPVWCGGMLEAGIGRAHNIALDAVRLHAARRYRRFGKVLARDIVEPPVTVSRAGTIPRQQRVWHRFRGQRSPRRGADGSP